jgi:hypothetical protein
VIEPDELKALCERIVKSGELGRSRTYASILHYLAEHALAGTSPKEISIAMEVLGREADFDVGKDSIVRVHIYHLRSKLNTYFARQGSTEKYRIDIPKGQYMLAITENVATEVPALESQEALTSITGTPLQRRNYTPVLAALALGLLLMNWFLPKQQAAAPVANPYAETLLWKPLLDDSLPILILVGDYYIMGQADASGNVSRMIREFDINSSAELNALQAQGVNANYVNLDLSYTPSSTATAVAQVMKALGADNTRVKVKMMSNLSTNDLVGQHIIYLGYLSGMQRLTDLMFADSGLAFGSTYDELINLDDDTLYTGSSGLSIGETSYRDYGMLSTFPAPGPGGAQYVLLGGMRDEGLINLVGEATELNKLASLQTAVEVSAQATQEKNIENAYEALYEVRGFNKTNFDTQLVFNKRLDTKVVWETRLLGQP